MKLSDIRDFVVVPTLQAINLAAPNRMQLIIGTGGVESGGYNYLDQTTPGPGPAYGFWQMEALTHDDIWNNYLRYQPSALRDAMLQLAGCRRTDPPPTVSVLHWNLRYAAAMCAVHYRRFETRRDNPAPLPHANDAEGMAEYWKRYYNTPLGKGTVVKALPYFQQAVNL